MSDPIINQRARSPFRYRRRQVESVEPVSPVWRPSLMVFRASTVNIAGMLAKAGKAADTTLSWGGEAEVEAGDESD
jgi:hypothetical protein